MVGVGGAAAEVVEHYASRTRYVCRLQLGQLLVTVYDLDSGRPLSRALMVSAGAWPELRRAIDSLAKLEGVG